MNLLTIGFQDAIGRLFGSSSGFCWRLPLVFILEESTVLPHSFQRWDARATSSFFGLRHTEVSEWMVGLLEGQHRGFTVPWES